MQSRINIKFEWYQILILIQNDLFLTCIVPGILNNNFFLRFSRYFCNIIEDEMNLFSYQLYSLIRIYISGGIIYRIENAPI